MSSSSGPSGAPFSISTKFTTLGFLVILISTVQTSFASSASSPLSTQTLYKKSTATKQLTNADRESISSLLAQWKDNNADTDKDQTATSSGVSAISSLYNDFKTIGGAGIEIFKGMPQGLLESASEIRSDDHTEGEYEYDTAVDHHDHHHEIQPEASYVPSHGHDGLAVLKPGVKEVQPYTFWDWLHSDGVSTAVVFFLFGVLPILIGLIPFIVIASNFWFIFHKIHGLYALFLGLGSHDDTYYGWPSSGWPSSSSGWPSSLPSSGWGWGEYSLDH